ncbi:transposase [Nodosilinea sp. LEGE 07088]|uniref:IS110 family transposase n=1 Tax=Nodosilinea sp. LEGE 07088 TaxID=2777968 RepID=UPI0018826F38|nr:transposase [Nodosilinea sp. LEGE 07088]MBE9137677.1 transposase [Nodosilinea sp. LEGE 07088]
MTKIIGIEVGKTSIVCCCLDSDNLPKNYPEFARSYTPQTLLPNLIGAQTLLELGEVFVIEPTGDYSKIWIDLLKANERCVLRVNPKRVKALKEYHGVMSKTDRYDGAFLALYGAENLDNPTAFLSDYAEELRESLLQHTFLSRMTGNHQRRLWQLLSREWPEVCRSRSGGKPRQVREFLEPTPPGLWRFIAGEDYQQAATRQRSLDESIGSGLSELSKTLATQVCELERKQYDMEQRIQALASASEFAPYHAVFDLFGFGPLTRASILSRIYPYQQFMGPDGKPIKIRVPSVKGNHTNRRNKSLGAFRLSLGNGTKTYQSGQLATERAAGPKYARVALYLHVRSQVVLRGNAPGLAPKYLAKHRDFYQALPPMPHTKAVSKVISHVVKDLYRELLATL